MRSLRSLPSREAGFVEPMECLAVAKLRDGGDWVYEILCARFLTVAVPLLRVWVHCQRASNGLLPRRSNLLGYVRWDARSDRFLLARQSIQQLFRSQSALSHKPISLALSRKAPRGSLPAFASSDVVEIRRRYLLHYREAFASSLMSCPHRCRSVFRRTFHCTFELPTSRPGWLAGRRRLP